MRVLVAVYGSVGGDPFGPMRVVVGWERSAERCSGVLPRGWAGVDIGKGHHWACLIDEDGTTMWSSMWSWKLVNDESAILAAIAAVCARAEQVTWAVEIT